MNTYSPLCSIPQTAALVLFAASCSSNSPATAGGMESSGTLTGTSTSGGPGSSTRSATGSGTGGSSTTGSVFTTSSGNGSGGVTGGSTTGVGETNATTDGAVTTGGTGGMDAESPRTRSSVNTGWRFTKNDPEGTPDLSYNATRQWVLPTGNPFLALEERAARPESTLGDGVAYIAADFDDSAWEAVDLPHDSAIAGPYTDSVSSSMGRLPSPGVTWYRKRLMIPASDGAQSVFLDIDGAMQYSLVWVNGEFVGGWPYGYSSYRLDLTHVVNAGEENVIAIRLATPTPANANWDSGSSRWYPGAGIYRNVWLNTTSPVHVGHWGTFVTTPQVSSGEASVNIDVTVDNDSDAEVWVSISTEIYELDATGQRGASPVASLAAAELSIPARSNAVAATGGSIANPKLWGVPPSQTPNMYLAVTTLRQGNTAVDVYHTKFGVRSIQFDGEGFRLNGELLKMNGVCLHHDLGALGAATNTRARQRQLEIMQEMGGNAIRTAHNPFEPEFYDLADRMGFLVMDEAFDVWDTGKAQLDHHAFFEDWYRQDLRALIRRDRNHPSVVMWSIGNEIPEQQEASGTARAQELTEICHAEDPTRPTVSGMNRAEPDDAFSGPIDTIGLNYQGTGVRDLGAQYPTYHAAFPDKFIVGTETTSTFSTRGTYLFPVTSSRGTPATGSSGVDAQAGIISSYDLYHADWSYSPDEEFESQDKWPYVGGEFVWTGFDYLGEPTPLDAVARSSYFGIVDLAGLKKDRFYLYQAYWRPDFPLAHILPHWTWPGREGEVTPVHVYTSGDSAELFVNDVSQGQKSKAEYEYRLRWDDVVYQPGSLRVVAYKGDAEWATVSVETAGSPAKLALTADRDAIAADGVDLSFVTLRVLDASDRFVPHATPTITFAISGPAEIVATDNGDPTDRQVFSSPERRAFSGMALAIVRALPNQSGEVTLTASASGLAPASLTIQTN